MQMLDKAKKLNKKIYLPVDIRSAKEFPNPIDDPSVTFYTHDITDIPADEEPLDIGPKTCELYAKVIKDAKTIIWNGPMGVFENPVFATGTKEIAKALAANSDATTIIGGGDSAAAVAQLGFADKMTHISTGGGASLELFEGKVLPGIACLNDK
jgi:phosphoglycerate kinase